MFLQVDIKTFIELIHIDINAEQIQEDAEAINEDSENDLDVLLSETLKEVVLWYLGIVLHLSQLQMDTFLAHFVIADDVCDGMNSRLLWIQDVDIKWMLTVFLKLWTVHAF